MTIKFLIKKITSYFMICIFAIWCLFPIYWLLATSLKTNLQTNADPPIFIFKPILDHYKLIIYDPDIWHIFFNSLVVASGTTVFSLAFGVPTAYALAKFKFRGNTDYSFWILSTRMAPPIAMLIPFYVMYNKIGILDTHLGLILAHISLNLSLVVWIMRGFFEDMPKEIEESSYVDGANYFSTFYKVSLPLSRNGIFAVGILCFLFSWNEFLMALILTDDNAKTVPVGIYKFVGYQLIKWAELAASAIFMIIPVFIFLVFFQKQLIKGLTMGAIR
jgi:multiple sugar transport system permease protein